MAGKAAGKESSQSSSYRSQQATIKSLSLLEKLDLVPAILSVVGNAAVALITGITRSKERLPESYYRHVVLTAMRSFTARTSTRQQHYISAPTDDVYAAVCKKRGVEPNSEILEDGTKAHWIGSSKAEKLILNFHGGGYVLPPAAGMFEFMFQIVDYLNKRGKNVSVLMLSYDLAPGAIYPRQLQQASMLLNHVLTNLKYHPSSILLSGDSAGANLATGLLSHISHPHPKIPKLSVDSPFLGVVLISPWISFETGNKSFQENEYKDVVNIPTGKKWSGAFLGCDWPHEGAKDEWNEAMRADESWWANLPVQQILVVGGEQEVLIDSIRRFSEKLKAGFRKEKVEVFIAKGEYHDQPSLDLEIGYKEKDEGEQAKFIKSWMASKL